MLTKVKKTSATVASRYFKISVWWKGIDGLLQILGGVILIFASNHQLNHWIYWLTRYNDDSNYLIVWMMVKLAHHVSYETQMAGVFYLWSHGVLKIALVSALFSQKIWAYVGALVLQASFVFFELLGFFTQGSFVLLSAGVLDGVIFFLIYAEYRRLKTP